MCHGWHLFTHGFILNKKDTMEKTPYLNTPSGIMAIIDLAAKLGLPPHLSQMSSLMNYSAVVMCELPDGKTVTLRLSLETEHPTI